MSLAEAQAATQAILANLTKGHDDLLKEATNKAVKPMNFAWDGDSVKGLKAMSENKAAFPVHDLGAPVEAFKPKVGENPLGTVPEYENAANWKSESGANYIPSPNKTVEGDVAGFKNFEGATMPSQFAWKLMDDKLEKQNVIEEENAQGDSQPEDDSQPEPEDAASEPIPAPEGAAGSVTKSNDANPTYFAWNEFQGKCETEYDAKFIDAHASPPVSAANKLLAPSLEGLMGGDEPLGQTEYDAAFVSSPTSSPVKAANKQGSPSLDGVMDIGEPMGETEYDAKFTGMEVGVTHVKKSAAQSLEGILDGGAPAANTEYNDNFTTSDAFTEMLEKVVHAHKEAKASLEGVFNYGDKTPFQTEYDASYVASVVKSTIAAAETATEGEVDTAAAQQDEGSSSSGSMEPASEAGPEPEALADEPAAKTGPVVIMDGGDSAAESISPSVRAPEAEADVPKEELAPVEEPVEEPAAAKQPAFNAFQSVSHTTYTWPATAGQKPEECKPAISDLIAGAIAAAPKEGSVLEGDLDGQMALAKKKMASEYDAKFAWPINSVNKRSYATGMPDSLWVMGTKGSVNVKPAKREPKIPKASTVNAEMDHLSGAACVPDTLDALDAAFKATATSAATAKPAPAKENRVVPTKNMPVAGYVPGAPKDILVSKDQPVEGQIPSLRTSLAPNPVSTLNALPLPRPPMAGGHRVGRILGAPMTLDPIRANPRYPQLSERQANRWATTSSSSYSAPIRLMRR